MGGGGQGDGPLQNFKWGGDGGAKIPPKIFQFLFVNISGTVLLCWALTNSWQHRN